eukprot:6846448-Alexandrium_andersonii.AAC.1
MWVSCGSSFGHSLEHKVFLGVRRGARVRGACWATRCTLWRLLQESVIALGMLWWLSSKRGEHRGCKHLQMYVKSAG